MDYCQTKNILILLYHTHHSESYIDSDCQVIANDTQVSRVSTRYMDVDFQTNPSPSRF